MHIGNLNNFGYYEDRPILTIYFAPNLQHLIYILYVVYLLCVAFSYHVHQLNKKYIQGLAVKTKQLWSKCRPRMIIPKLARKTIFMGWKAVPLNLIFIT